jgi:high-affinity nickel-transport protein
MLDALLAGAVGLAQGLRHALEPDHVTALATVAVSAPSTKQSVAYAALWGLGHGLVLVLLGGALVLVGSALPEGVANALELTVAAMLVALGVRAWRRRAAAHRHGEPPKNVPPVLIGCVHGLAGTGALVAVVLASGGSRAASVVALALYASGAAVGMMLLAGAAGPAMARLGRSDRAASILSRVAGAASVALGVVWGAKAVLALAA